jgi:hypothetical protein
LKYLIKIHQLRILPMVLAMCAAAPVVGATDATRAYLNAYDDRCAFGAAHTKALRGYKVLLVPGYLGDLYPTYFADQMRWLASTGVEHEKVAIASGDSVATNGPIVAKAIRESAKPVILITHSKGSIDVLEALLSESRLRARVKGWISLQGTFFGSPVADKLLDDSLLNPLVAMAVLGFFGGNRASAQSLTTAASRAYYRQHAVAISALLREVPALAFASAVDAAPGAQPKTSLEIPHQLMARDGIQSDGLVPLVAAVLPGMDFVKVIGVDHIATVMPARQHYDRVRMTQALLLALRAPLRGLPRDAGCTARR